MIILIMSFNLLIFLEFVQKPISVNISVNEVAEFTCIVNCSDYVNWYIDNGPPSSEDNVTKVRDNPSPGLLTAKLWIRAESCGDVLIKCSTFPEYDHTMHKITVAVLHIVQGIIHIHMQVATIIVDT